MTPDRIRSGDEASTAVGRRFLRTTDVVWRVTSDRLILRRIGRSGSDDAVELVGEAALTWVAAESASTTVELAEATGVDATIVVQAVELLVDAGWMVPA